MHFFNTAIVTVINNIKINQLELIFYNRIAQYGYYFMVISKSMTDCASTPVANSACTSMI